VSAWALVVAAGAGARLGIERPKAFAQLAGRPLLAESLDRLDRCAVVDAIVVAAPPGWEEPTILLSEELAATKVVACVTGGETRAERVLEPLGRGFDGAVPALPLEDTVKRVVEGVVEETVERDGLFRAQTPQAFLAPALRRAFDGDLGRATDCASLVERAGGRVAVVEGDPRLVKVTTAADLALVETLLAAR